MPPAVIVPWSRGNPTRERVFEWVCERFDELHPEWDALLADGVGFEDTRPWAKAWAVNQAVLLSCAHGRGDPLVICDADVAIAPAALYPAVRAVTLGAAWSIPHGRVFRLNPDATDRLLYSAPEAMLTPPNRADLERPPYEGLPGGGLLVVSRKSWELVGGFDERFKGWGSEDFALGVALDTLAGQHHRGTAPLLHLYHPRADRTDQVDRNQALEARYAEANGKPEAMRALIDERK